MNRHGMDNRARRGMTLIEAVISIVIVATMLVASVSSLGSFARSRRSQFDRCAGGTLARGLMSEILQTRYLEPDVDVYFGLDVGESATVRTAWDDVDDYNGLNETPPKTKTGLAITGATGWTRKVTVEYVQPGNPNQTSTTDTGLVRITVSAISPRGVTTTLQALRGDQSIYDQPPRTDTTYVSWVVTEMQIGADQAKRLTTSTHVLNRIPVP